MTDLKDPRLIYLKAGLFLLAGSIAGLLLVADNASVKTLALLIICVWCFARAYYFAFYVIEHYVDGEYRFAGLWDFARYLRSRRTQRNSAED